MLKKYLIRFVNQLIDFRLMEFQSLCSLYKLNCLYVEKPSEKPFLILETDNEERLLKVFQRSVLATSLYELWASSTNFDQFFREMNCCEYITNENYSKCSFRIQVETFGKKISLASKMERIERLDFLPFQGPIRLKDPEVTFYYMEYFGLDGNNIPEKPYQIIFGKWIADSNRKMISTFSLKTRKFIANTSMEPTLAFLMSNIAKINNNDIVYDPFVGSGSLLVSAAYFGAYVCGTDIDYLLLHGLAKPSRVGVKEREKDESVVANLKQYGLQSKYLDVIAGDSSLPLIRNNFEFDAIITDPPYGKRESRERIGTMKKHINIPEKCLATHVPSKLEYNIEDIYYDLLNFSAQHLKLNGLLLFWAPYSKKLEGDQQKEPLTKTKQCIRIMSFFLNDNCTDLEQVLRQKFKHPNFRFVSYAQQNLTCKYSRILIAMERIL